MKIRRNTACPPRKKLGETRPGETFMFCKNLHQKHRDDDLFIRLEACSSYRPEGYRYCNAVACANLRTGALAYARQDSNVEPVYAEVCAD